MSDVLFIFLITVAVAALCWFDQPPVTVSVIAGLMIGYAGSSGPWGNRCWPLWWWPCCCAG